MENHIKLVVTSRHLSPEEIVTAIGLKGDNEWAVGQRRGDSEIRETDNGVSISSKLKNDSDVSLHIESIMALVAGLEGNFMKFSKIPDCEIQLSCAIYCRGAPPLSLEKPIISWISSMGASLDIDIYLI